MAPLQGTCITVCIAPQPSRLPYPSDLSDARWALMEPTLAAWRAERQKTSLNLGGKVSDLREVMNAILFLNGARAPWRYLPHDFPPRTTVFGYFSTWTADGRRFYKRCTSPEAGFVARSYPAPGFRAGPALRRLCSMRRGWSMVV